MAHTVPWIWTFHRKIPSKDLICPRLTKAQVLVGIVFYYLVPDNQLNCRWMDERERLLAIERVKENEQGIGNRKYKWY